MKLHLKELLNTPHISFHTPGHKNTAEGDLTELDYTDNLASPTGAIKRAQEDIANILGASASFLLTDGSTSGVYAMLYALKEYGATRIAAGERSHPCVKRGCELMGLEFVPVPASFDRGTQPSFHDWARALQKADAALVTSPDYYGYFAPLNELAHWTAKENKPLLIDGAHGAHLHFTKDYAGRYADLWVDGVHKSLPALTQGAVVSAKTKEWAERLRRAVAYFRTSSPSYPIMASVEYAVKYPRNEKIERAAQEAKEALGALANDDWTKIVIPFGANTDRAQAALEEAGIYPEFNDGEHLALYLSPCTKEEDLYKAVEILQKIPRGEGVSARGERVRIPEGATAERVPLSQAVGRIAAESAGLFPPCVPLFVRGERITAAAVARLAHAKSKFGADGETLFVIKE